MTRARGRRTEVFVTLGAIRYGFLASSRSTPYRTALGHTVVTDSNRSTVIFGANSPKPNRATREVTGETISSFCDPSQEATLAGSGAGGGWTIIRFSRRRGITSTPKVQTVCVDMPGGWRYAWNITREELTLAPDLGFSVPTSTDNLVFGAQRPKPPRASRRENGQTTSTFIEPSQTIIDAVLADGWSVSGVTGLLAET